MASGDASDVPGTIPTNLRLLMVLEEMAKAGVPVTPTEVNTTLGLPKPTIHRLFTTLETEGFIQREIDGRGYSAGPRARTLSAGILSSQRIRTVRVAILSGLAEQIGETCNIALPEHDGMVYIERIETKWPLRIQMPVGTRVPFYCTAAGKLYLASLSDAQLDRYANTADYQNFTTNTLTDPAKLIHEIDQVRANGYATDNQEFMEGMVAVGVGITDGAGRLLSTLAFHAPVQRLSMEDAKAHLHHLRLAATSLSALVSG